ncbi:MAG TPA: hypothetical protein DHN29_21635 [Cytophagales bacterium]|nr:hypothetical protein [Cytophagales bacterium]
MKVCIRCNETKSFTEFYKNRTSNDGYQNWCKQCLNAFNQKYRREHREKRLMGVRKYNESEKGKAARSRYVVSEKRRCSQRLCSNNYKLKYPERRKANKAVERAILTGKLIRLPCEVCKYEPAEAHHDDYSKSLDVRWLCTMHHKKHHCVVGISQFSKERVIV